MLLHRKWLKGLVKITIGCLLVVYVLKSRMVDFGALGVVLFSPLNLLISFLVFAFSVFCCCSRWYILAYHQALSFSFKRLIEISMIGNFFNTFMPGSVGGDLVKAWYVAGAEPNRKTKAILTVILDRALGLSVILFYAAFTLLFYHEWMSENTQLQALGFFLWGYTGFSILFMVLFFSPLKLPRLTRSLESFRRLKPFANILDAIGLYRSHPKPVCLALILSISSILGICVLYIFLGNRLGLTLRFPYYFFVVPLGLTISAVPLLPGGIGVGQVAFFTLFSWVGANPEQGATLCTLVQVYSILFNCTGSIFYLRYKKQPQVRESVVTNQFISRPTSEKREKRV